MALLQVSQFLLPLSDIDGFFLAGPGLASMPPAFSSSQESNAGLIMIPQAQKTASVVVGRYSVGPFFRRRRRSWNSSCPLGCDGIRTLSIDGREVQDPREFHWFSPLASASAIRVLLLLVKVSILPQLILCCCCGGGGRRCWQTLQSLKETSVPSAPPSEVRS